MRTAPFFVERFGTMHWMITTPDGIAQWDRKTLRFLGPSRELDVPAADAAEALWLAYYESIFNPARLNLAMMRKEMPVEYWKHLPEAARIPALVAAGDAARGRDDRANPRVRARQRRRTCSATGDAFLAACLPALRAMGTRNPARARCRASVGEVDAGR